MTTDQAVGQPYGIKGYPTIKLFSEDKKKPIDYSGGRTKKEITAFTRKHIQDTLNQRTGGKQAPPESDVVVLTAANFDSFVLKSREL